MTKRQGTVRRSDLEGGLWQLVADDGKTYELKGGDAGLLKAGARAEVTGRIEQSQMSLGMAGPIFSVSAYRLIG
jgi:hypothetical protein